MIIKDCLAALPHETEPVRVSLRVRGERFAEIARSLEPEAGEEVVDATGLLLLPGAIDPHVHFDEPGFTHREDFLHGTMEAAKGGVTTVIDMPCTSLPPVTTMAALRNKLAAIGGHAVVDYALFGGVEGGSVEASLAGAMAELGGGVVGYKCYFISGMDSFAQVGHKDFERIVAEGARLGRPILLHAEDLDCVVSSTARAKARRGAARPEWADYVESRDESAELVAVVSALALARGREASLHIVHVGTAAAAEAVAAAGASCETCAHYLAFTSADFARLGASLKTAPVVKAAEREALWALLAAGKIDFLASDHAPAPAAEKETGDIWTAYGGIPGTGTMLPWLLSEGYLSGRLAMSRFLEAICGAAAGRYGLSGRKGSVAGGKDADFVLVDPKARTRIEGRRLLSKGKITPFEGMELRGRIEATYLRGRRIFDARIFDARAFEAQSFQNGISTSDRPGILVEPGYGRYLTWGYR
jgi:allantoinase